MDALIGFIVFLVLIILGYTVGSYRERSHLRDLRQREEEFRGMICTDFRRLPPGWHSDGGFLVEGQAVIGSDYFKTVVAHLRNIFGGRVRSFETLMARARREAILRMLEKARRRGANAVWNVRLETSTIGRGAGRGGLPIAEIHAYGTGYHVAPPLKEQG